MNLKIEYLPISEIKQYDKNTRNHQEFDIGEIAKSIEKYGFSDPIGIWGENNIIVEGHGRVMAAAKLGLNEVPCIRLDHLTDKERREYAIVHNKTAELSMWDTNNLSEELADVDLSDFEFDFPIIEEFDLDISDDDFISDTEITKSKVKTCKCPECGHEFEV